MSIVVNWYQEKTRSILKKYGPGPRVHYHMGILPKDVTPASNQALLQAQLTQSQEDMISVAADFWGIDNLKGKRLLDVGAGLGGASLWMAMQKRADVHSLVQFAEHARVIRSFSRMCGVPDQVKVFQGDAHTHTSDDGQKYDVIMAMESPCYFDRPKWFRHLDTILAEGGRICLEDALLGPNPPADARPVFDAYWKTKIGSVPEYMDAAKAAGFVGKNLDLTAETAEFWRLSVAWIKNEMAQAQNEQVLAKYQRSLNSALFHYDYWNKGHYRIALFTLQRASEVS